MVRVPLSNVTVSDDVMMSLIPPRYENTRTKLQLSWIAGLCFFSFYDYML